MKRTIPSLVHAIIFLFFIQAAGTLVESIYILDLMHTSLDAKILGLLFFFSPLLLIPFFKIIPRQLVWVTFALVLLSRSMMPYLNTANRMVAAGLATGAVLSLFFLLLNARPREEPHARIGLWGSAGLALAVSLSVLLRSVNFGIDYSLTPAGGWTGILLGLVLGGLLTQIDPGNQPAAQKKAEGVTPAVLGIFLVLTLVYFAFSAPAVIARWTEGNYTLIVAAISLLSIGWVLISPLRTHFRQIIDRRVLAVWNLAFTVCLTGTILAHGVPFPATPDAPYVIVGAPLWWQAVVLILMLILFPVLFIDLDVFLEQISQASPAPRDLIPGILLGCLALILLVFANIFTDVWGYIKPVSLFFRGKFWLAYFLPAGLISLLVWTVNRGRAGSRTESAGKSHWVWKLLMGLIFLSTLMRALPVKRLEVDKTEKASLVVMTYNIQEANDATAEKSFDRQLALIRKVSPDILSLQETDSTRISLNNNDYVRYFADNLGYYSYYGPTTVAGTYGTAILSKFPLLDTRTMYTYSDTDEIGIAEVQIEVNGLRFYIYDVHPDGSDTAKLAFAQALLKRSEDKTYVIALGDYNLRDHEQAYQLINSVFTNAWTSVYPSKISTDGVDMSGDNRIDHIFVSHSLGVRAPTYLLPPESATDHPAHWAEIFWGKAK
jgi:endonuclease/exonuclease/phosphatase family metal-dependent hydrolase